MKKLIYIPVLILIVSCGSSRTVEKVTTSSIKDSTWTQIEYIPIDTTFTIAADSVRLAVPLSELKQRPVTKTSKSGRTKARVSKQNDTLVIDCQAQELEKQITLLKEVIAHYRKIAEDSSETIIVPKPYTPNFIKVLAWLGGIFIALIIAGAVLLIKNIVKP